MIGTASERIKELNILYPHWEDFTQWTWFKKNAQRFADQVFLIVDDQKYLYSEILSLCTGLSRSLYAVGLRSGMTVALSVENRKEMPAISFALSRLGCVNVLVNARLSDQEKQYILDKTDAVLMITDQDIRRRKKDAKIQCHILTDGDSKEEQILSLEKGSTITLDHLLEYGHEINDDIVESYAKKIHNPDALSTIIFTSGSTGKPKGVMLTDNMLIRSSFATVNTRHMEIGRRMYLPVPYFHALGFVEGLLSAVAIGGSLVVYTKRCTSEDHLNHIIKWEVNDIVSVSTIITRILIDMQDRSRQYQFPNLHAIYYAGAFPKWVWAQSKRFFGVHDCGTGYGMTECSSTSNIYWKPEKCAAGSSQTGDCAEVAEIVHGKVKSAGIAAFPEESNQILSLKITDTYNQNCPPGIPGEILLKGISVTPGYYDDPEATSEHIDEDGWFHTGDMGKLTEEGELIFVGRMDDQYKVNGENVSPKHVEEQILSMPGISYAEVVAVPHVSCGQVGVAFVELGDETATIEEIREYLSDKLAKFQQPKDFIIMRKEDWPRAGMGKISKSKLREIAQQKFDYTR